MVQVYYKLVKAGRRTIDQVPEHLRSEVQALLDADAASNFNNDLEGGNIRAG